MPTPPAAVSEPLTPVRPQLPDAPTTLVLSEHPVFKRFFYAVCFSRDVGDEPLARRLLGTDLVVWRSAPDAPVSVALDRCAHRDAPLSRGWLKRCHLVCPYHGWEWDRRGATQRIPQFPGARRPSKSGLTMVTSEERYDMVWVCLDEAPLAGVPPLPEFDDPMWRVVPEQEFPFACTAMHLLENNFDPGHVAFVHRNTFGNPDKAELTDPAVTRRPHGLETLAQVPVEARPGAVGATLRTTTGTVYAPFFASILITYPDGLRHLMVKAITPVDDQSCNLLQTVLRTDTEGDLAGRQIHDFDIRVEDEDRALLELLPTPFPLAVHLNAHARADRSSLALRRMWSELVTGSWTPTW